jgi:hypothetical protein
MFKRTSTLALATAFWSAQVEAKQEYVVASTAHSAYPDIRTTESIRDMTGEKIIRVYSGQNNISTLCKGIPNMNTCREKIAGLLQAR